MAETFDRLSNVYANLSAVGTASHRVDIEFFLVDRNKIYTVDGGCGDRFRKMMAGKSVVRVVQVERWDGKSVEHQHCWNTFEIPVHFQNLRNVDPTQQSIRRAQYVTEAELPGLVMFADVVRESVLHISLYEHANFETNKAITVMSACAGELEGLFVSGRKAEFFQNWKPQFENALERLRELMRSTFVVEESLFSMYKLVLGSPDRERVMSLAKRLWPHLRHVIALYNTGLELVGEKNNDAVWFKKSLSEFTEMFELPADLKDLENKRSSPKLTLRFSTMS